ncbi:MAG: biotin-dependent carboxyltransferase family protein [Actinomycetota bacterium]
MTGAAIEVIRAGPMVTVQDAGRPGLLRYGIPASGPVDRLGHAAANVACGNEPGAAAVEVSAGGAELRPDVALTFGFADAALTVSDRAVSTSWGAVTVAAGEVITVRPVRGRRWAYLATTGALQTTVWFGSSSTHVSSGLGGGVVATGDRFEVTNAHLRADLDGPVADPRADDGDRPVRVVLGPQEEAFVSGAVNELVSKPFAAGVGDRMGVRLDGPSLEPADALTIPSEPVVRGSVQVAGDGVPTVLLADHQTTGGYPKIATVLTADCDVVAQRPVGAEVRFVAVDTVEAIAVARAEAVERQRFLLGLAAPDRTLAQRLFSRNLQPGGEPY